LILLFIGEPIGAFMAALSSWLNGMQNSSKIILGIILGAMITFDMGGPLNKTAFFFAVAMIPTNPTLMAAVATAVCTPPLGLALATFIFKKKFTVAEQESGKAALIMGCIGITEGAIPFAAADPIKVLPSIMIGGAAASVTSLLLGPTSQAAWGGLIVLPVVTNKIGFKLHEFYAFIMKMLFLKFDLKFYLKLGGDEMTTDAINRVKDVELEAKSLIDVAKLEATTLRKNSKNECENISEKVLSEANKKAEEIKFGLINEGEMLAKPVIEKAKREVEHIKSVDEKKLESVVNSIVERIVSVNGNS